MPIAFRCDHMLVRYVLQQRATKRGWWNRIVAIDGNKREQVDEYLRWKGGKAREEEQSPSSTCATAKTVRDIILLRKARGSPRVSRKRSSAGGNEGPEHGRNPEQESGKQGIGRG